jgi:bifunctional UDP-N-acetylglucosamine pyrophosphorylase/glucosamine-1-phosphate N-acetyltransferase
MRTRLAVIAAAGRGTRFLAEQPKVLADLGGRPCLQRVLDTVEAALGEHRQMVVIGPRGDEIRAALGEAPNRRYVEAEPHGTGAALTAALAALDEADGDLYFLAGDKPLLRPATLGGLRAQFERGQAVMAFLTGRLAGDPGASRQGRVVTAGGQALGIVERKVIEALRGELELPGPDGGRHRFSRAQLLAIRDVNVSVYVWRLAELRRLAAHLTDANAQGELLVTDLVQLAVARGLRVETRPLADAREGQGIDTVEQWQALAAEEPA